MCKNLSRYNVKYKNLLRILQIVKIVSYTVMGNRSSPFIYIEQKL